MGVSIIQAAPLPTPASSPPMLCGGKRHSFRTVCSVAGNTIPSWARERAPRRDGGDGRKAVRCSGAGNPADTDVRGWT